MAAVRPPGVDPGCRCAMSPMSSGLSSPSWRPKVYITPTPCPSPSRGPMLRFPSCSAIRCVTTGGAARKHAAAIGISTSQPDSRGQLVGMCTLHADRFPVLRTATTGSWLGRAFQRQGLGREMRQAALHLLFDGLGGRRATTRVWHDNSASLGVTRSLPYSADGVTGNRAVAVPTPCCRSRCPGRSGRPSAAPISSSPGQVRSGISLPSEPAGGLSTGSADCCEGP